MQWNYNLFGAVPTIPSIRNVFPTFNCCRALCFDASHKNRSPPNEISVKTLLLQVLHASSNPFPWRVAQARRIATDRRQGKAGTRVHWVSWPKVGVIAGIVVTAMPMPLAV